MSTTTRPPVRDDRTLTREEREAERSRQRALRFDTKPNAARVTARVIRIKSEKAPRLDLGRRKLWTRHLHTPRPRVAPVTQYSRRAFVRVRYANAKKAGQWRAHGLYLEREGAQREGGRGVGFSAAEDGVSLSRLADRWQTAGDERMFKLVLSPEDGGRLDLKGYTRRFMSRFEQQAGQPLEWAAIDHHNTDNPHVHVLVRGKRDLILSPELVSKHARNIAMDEATRELGYRTPQEISAGREREIDQRRFTGLDREIQRLAVREPPARDGQEPPGTWLVEMPTMTERTATAQHRERRRQHVGRLQALETIGVAERVGHMTWRLDAGWDKALKELDTIHSRSTMLMQHRELMTDARALPVVTKLQPGQRLTGRVLGTGLDDSKDTPYLLIEGSDGRAHFIMQTLQMHDERGEGRLKPGVLASIEVKPGKGKNGRPTMTVEDHGLEIPARGFTTVPIPATVLDADLKNREQQGQSLPDPPATVGFAAHYQRALLERDRQRRLDVERKRQRARTNGKKIGDDEDGIA